MKSLRRDGSVIPSMLEPLESRLLLDGAADLNPSIPADAAILALAASFTEVPAYTAPQAATAREALRDVVETDAASLVYGAFAEFARWHFGAGSEPMVYQLYGSELGVVEASTWRHVSENSASLAWETNLPAYTFVQYGITSAYGGTTEMSDRAYYQHLHQPRDLAINTPWCGFSIKRALQGVGILGYFRTRTYSSDAQLAKPDPRFFELVARRARIEGLRICYVRDRIEEDVKGPKAVGWAAALRLNADNRDRADLADYTFGHSSELVAWLLEE